ncbi:MAG: LamG domain-containing protein, partial [Moorea sp. SIO2B7]|nr:LamG domain-containing protein [Moorena sp. SIO2B7]
LYIDGEVVYSKQTPVGFGDITTSSNVRIGSGFKEMRFFSGLIDEVSMYDKALSSDRIKAHYNASSDDPVPQHVPESSSTLALLALGALSGISLLKKKNNVVK